MQHNLFIGRVGDTPSVSGVSERAVGKFRLLSNEYAGKEENGDAREKLVSIPFTAFGKQAEAIAKHVMKGDELKVEFRIENNHYKNKDQEDVYDYNFVVESFEFGAPGQAKRDQLQQK